MKPTSAFFISILFYYFFFPSVWFLFSFPFFLSPSFSLVLLVASSVSLLSFLSIPSPFSFSSIPSSLRFISFLISPEFPLAFLFFIFLLYYSFPILSFSLMFSLPPSIIYILPFSPSSSSTLYLSFTPYVSPLFSSFPSLCHFSLPSIPFFLSSSPMHPLFLLFSHTSITFLLSLPVLLRLLSLHSLPLRLDILLQHDSHISGVFLPANLPSEITAHRKFSFAPDAPQIKPHPLTSSRGWSVDVSVGEGVNESVSVAWEWTWAYGWRQTWVEK